MKEGFLPQDYQLPEEKTKSGGDYMKFEPGDNRFRILASPVTGWVWWEEDSEGNKKPVRVKKVNEIRDESAKHFWAMPVFSYASKTVKILEITQRTIQDAIYGFANDPDWGSPLNYDLVVRKTGEQLKTAYTVSNKPTTELDPRIAKMFEEKKINMDALFTGENPFSATQAPLPEPTDEAPAVKTEDGDIDLSDLPF